MPRGSTVCVGECRETATIETSLKTIAGAAGQRLLLLLLLQLAHFFFSEFLFVFLVVIFFSSPPLSGDLMI